VIAIGQVALGQPLVCGRQRRVRRRPGMRMLVGAGLLWLALAGCGAVATPTPAATETLTFTSPADTLPLVRELAQSFAAARPGIVVQFVESSAADAPSAVRNGEASVAMVIGQDTALGPGLRLYEIARQPLSVIVNHDNTLKALTLDALGAIYAGRATDWQQVGGPAAPIMVLSREPGAAMRLRFDQITLGSGPRLTPNALILPSDEAVVATVARRPESIGYISGAASLTSVRTLTIDGESPAGIVRGRAYPLWQSIHVVTSASPSAGVQSFVGYVKTKAGQRIIASLGYGQGGASQ